MSNKNAYFTEKTHGYYTVFAVLCQDISDILT